MGQRRSQAPELPFLQVDTSLTSREYACCWLWFIIDEMRGRQKLKVNLGSRGINFDCTRSHRESCRKVASSLRSFARYGKAIPAYYYQFYKH